MMKRQKKSFKKIYLTIIALIILFITFLLLLNYKNNNIKTFSNKHYSLSYDASWNIKNKEDKKIVLKNKHGNLNIEITTLPDKYHYYKLTDFVEELLSGIEKQNKTYKLLAKQEKKLLQMNMKVIRLYTRMVKIKYC